MAIGIRDNAGNLTIISSTDRENWFSIIASSTRTDEVVTVNSIPNITRTRVVPLSPGSDGAIITRYLYKGVILNSGGTIVAADGGLLWSINDTLPTTADSFNIKTS